MLKMKNITTKNTQELSQKEKRNAQARARYAANPDKYRNAAKSLYAKNKEMAAAKVREWRKNNKEKVNEMAKLWRENNPEAYKKIKKRERSTPERKLRQAVYHAFTRIRKNKPTDTQTLLGCTWEEAKAHFESLFQEGMSWDNHGEWHIDHIRPVASFNEDEIHLMNHISNLQPLWAEDNLSKGDKFYTSSFSSK